MMKFSKYQLVMPASEHDLKHITRNELGPLWMRLGHPPWKVCNPAKGGDPGMITLHNFSGGEYPEGFLAKRFLPAKPEEPLSHFL